MTSLKEWNMKMSEKEKQRHNELCFEQAISMGVSKDFLLAFETRMALFPYKQTEIFLQSLENPTEHIERKKQKIDQWLIWLKVLEKERPTDKNIEQWHLSIKLIENKAK